MVCVGAPGARAVSRSQLYVSRSPRADISKGATGEVGLLLLTTRAFCLHSVLFSGLAGKLDRETESG